MDKGILMVMGLLSINLVACTNQDQSDLLTEQQETINQQEQRITDLEETVSQQEELINQLTMPFSYLEQLSEQDKRLATLFIEDKKQERLANLSPESALLLYLHGFATDDVELIHALTYNNGQFDDLETFSTVLYDGMAASDVKEDALTYRYFDQLTVKEASDADNDRLVEIGVALGSSRYVTVYQLTHQDNRWKVTYPNF